MSAPVDDTLKESEIPDAEPPPGPDATPNADGEPGDDPNHDSESDQDYEPGGGNADEPEEDAQNETADEAEAEAEAEAAGTESTEKDDAASASDDAEEPADAGNEAATAGPSSGRGGFAGRGRGRGRGRGGGRGSRAGTRTSRATKAGLTFSVSKVENQLRDMKVAERIGAGAPVFLAAVLEYLIAEMVELGGNCARDNKHKRIIPRDIRLAVKNDVELDKLCGDAMFPGAGGVPLIHSVLLPKKKPSKKASQEM